MRTRGALCRPGSVVIGESADGEVRAVRCDLIVMDGIALGDWADSIGGCNTGVVE
ncbi:hypothetical protein [Brachybacterium timonense]|uniref:hypothetical protein n=1 Tax=Brachybacterium timonense TaxID=2050896 RepID=UPI0014834032|nr:hypothetical protein [Brachybacterium timonense]